MLVFFTFLGLESYSYKAHPGSSSILSDMPCGAADLFFDTLEPLLTLFLPLGTFSLYYHCYVGSTSPSFRTWPKYLGIRSCLPASASYSTRLVALNLG